jgi:hypothetical protein
VLLPLMPLVISRAGSTTSMAKMPLMTRFMVSSARWSQHSLNQEEPEEEPAAACQVRLQQCNRRDSTVNLQLMWSLNCTSPAGSSQGVPAVLWRT